MTSIKIVVGAAIAAFVAMNVVGAAVIFSGMTAFDRVGNFAERLTDDRQTGQSELRPDDDFDGGDFQAPRQNFVGAPPAPGFFEGKGKGGKGGKGAWEIAYAVENANVGIRDAEDIALGEVSGDIVEAKLKGKDGSPH